MTTNTTDAECIINKKIVDGVEITQYKDGHTIFKPVVEPEKKTEVKKESWFESIINWFKTSKVTPYAKIRDLSNPFGDRQDSSGGSKRAAEIGIKIRF